MLTTSVIGMTTLLAVLIALAPAPSITVTVDGIDRPVCYEEDGSDSATLPCVWTDPDTHTDYLTFADYSVRIER
jgi:hypothetical protein